MISHCCCGVSVQTSHSSLVKKDCPLLFCRHPYSSCYPDPPLIIPNTPLLLKSYCKLKMQCALYSGQFYQEKLLWVSDLPNSELFKLIVIIFFCWFVGPCLMCIFFSVVPASKTLHNCSAFSQLFQWGIEAVCSPYHIVTCEASLFISLFYNPVQIQKPW